MGKTAVVTVDYQRDYFPGRLPFFPWTSHRAFMAALGAHHAQVVKAAEAVRLLGGA